MRRLTISGALCALTALSASAFADTQAEQAGKLNDEGKELMYGGKYAEATAKFREAVARVPEAKYFFNLCTSLFQEGQFSDALTACDAVANNKPSAELQAKATKLIGRIEETLTKQGLKVTRGGGGGLPNETPPPASCQTDPNLPECKAPANQPRVVGQAPTGPSVFKGVKPNNQYLWTLGANVFAGGGAIGQPDVYGTAVGGIQLKADYMFMPQARIGTQAYVQYSQFSQGAEQAGFAFGLTAVDLGVGLYKHICPASTERLCLKPMIGAHLALFSPEFDQTESSTQFNYAAVGVRLELGLEWAFGARMEHVLSVTIGANGYSAVVSGPSDLGVTAMDAGLDKGGGYGYFGVGYTHRFATPLGYRPFVTLE